MFHPQPVPYGACLVSGGCGLRDYSAATELCGSPAQREQDPFDTQNVYCWGGEAADCGGGGSQIPSPYGQQQRQHQQHHQQHLHVQAPFLAAPLQAHCGYPHPPRPGALAGQQQPLALAHACLDPFPQLEPPARTSLRGAQTRHHLHQQQLRQQRHRRHHHKKTRHTHAATRHGIVKMEAPSPQDDLAAQEAAAREYQPQLEGPLVGDKTTSHAITDAYAKADPVYVGKTIALPETYSHYRPIQGDGNCGWRAIGFGYFENLILTATEAKVAAEIERITGLNQYMEHVGGYGPFVWEDMVEETLAILAYISANLDSPDAALAELQQRFNSIEVSNAVIYHLRLLAASHLKENVARYEPFIPEGVQAYLTGTIEPTHREIDHMGVTLLVEVLLRPAGFVLEIVYLDRSPMSKANTYRFPAETAGQDESGLGPMVHLLYRPDHYDILYKPPPAPVQVQVHRAASFTEDIQIAPSGISACGHLSTADFELLTLIPGFGLATSSSAMEPMLSFGPGPGSYTTSSESQVSSWGASPFSVSLPIRHPPAQSSASPTLSVATSQPHQQSQLPAELAVDPQDPSSMAPSPPLTTHPMRFSKYSYPSKPPELLADVTTVDDQAHAFAAAATQQQSLLTPMFRESHWNKAHYSNPDFQPEEYTRPHPDECRRSANEDDSEGTSGSGGRKRREKPAKTIKREVIKRERE